MRSGGPLVLILALATGLRLNALREGLWYDEIGALVRYARRPFLDILTTFDNQNQHLLFSLLAHASWKLLPGDEVFALRLPAALFGVASIWAVWWLGTKVTSQREALLTAALLAVSSHHVWFSQNARGYTMMMFFCVVGTVLFMRLMDRAATRAAPTAATYAIVMALASWTQVAGAFVAVAHGIVWLIQSAREKKWSWQAPSAIALAGVISILLYAPVLAEMTKTLAGPKATGGATEWKSPFWFAIEAAQGLARGLPGGWLTLLIAVSVAVSGLWSYWRRSQLVTLLFIMPVLVTAAIMLMTAHNLWPRLFFFAAGFAALIAVRGGFWICKRVFKERGELIATGGAVLACVGSLATVPRVWAPKQDYEGARRYLAANLQPGDAAVTVDMTKLPYRDYYDTGWIEADSLPELAEVDTVAPRTYVLVTFPERLRAVDPAMWNRLQERYREVARFNGSVQGGAILVMQKDRESGVGNRESGSP